MATGFRRPIQVTFHVPTPSGSLIETSGGHNAAGNVAISVLEGDGTGYTNYWTDYTVPAQFIPGIAKRYDLQSNGFRFLGECSIKVDTQYTGIINSGSHLTIGDVEWDYSRLAERGAGFANDRLILVLNRRKDS